MTEPTIDVELMELDVLKRAAAEPDGPNDRDDKEDPYGMETPSGRRLRRQHQDRLAHLFLAGLRVVRAEKKREIK